MSGPDTGGRLSIERRANRIANARSVTFGLAGTFVALAFVGAVVMHFADSGNFPSLGLAVWWALQTMTTVGYGDVVPTTAAGRFVGGIEMVIGISLISLLTASVTSTVIAHGQSAAQAEERRLMEESAHETAAALAQVHDLLAGVDARLTAIERELSRR